MFPRWLLLFDCCQNVLSIKCSTVQCSKAIQKVQYSTEQYNAVQYSILGSADDQRTAASLVETLHPAQLLCDRWWDGHSDEATCSLTSTICCIPSVNFDGIDHLVRLNATDG